MEQPSKRRKIAQNGDTTSCMLKGTKEEADPGTYEPLFVREFREREIRRSRKEQRFYRRQDVKVHTAITTATVEVFHTTGDDGIPTPMMTIGPAPSPEATGQPDSSNPPSSPPLPPNEPAEPVEPDAPVGPVDPAESAEPAEPAEQAEPAEPPPSEEVPEPPPEPEPPVLPDEPTNELLDAPADQPSAEISDQPPDEQLGDSATESEDEPSDAALIAADVSGSDGDGGSSDLDEAVSSSDTNEDSTDEDSDETASVDESSETDTSRDPKTVLLSDDIPTDATLLTTRKLSSLDVTTITEGANNDSVVTFSIGSSTWASLLTIDLDSVTTISDLATSSEPFSDVNISIRTSSPTSRSNTSAGNGISTDGFDETGGLVVVATGSPDTTREESDSDGGDGGSGDTVDTPEVVGGVVGGIAGLAIILLVALLALRWYRNRRQSSQALPGSENENPAGGTASTRPLAEGAFAGSAAGMFKQLSRMNRRSRGTSSTPPMAQRSFERVSGRKLPSAFSPALAANTSPTAAGASTGFGTYSRTQDVSRPVINPTTAGAVGAGTAGTVGAATPLNNNDDGNDNDDDSATSLSDASSYRDGRTDPFVTSGEVTSSGAVVGVGRPSGLEETETIRPSPARTPVIHAASGPPYQQHPHPDALSPPVTPLGQQSAGIGSSGGGLVPSNQTGQSSPRPTRPGGGTLGRSLSSFDGSRSSRFTEDV